MNHKFFLGIRFWNSDTESLLASADQAGGLFTVPSAPSLGAMDADAPLRRAYRASDWAVVDGGYVALILRICFGRSIRRISGLQILQKLIGVGHQHAIPMKERVILWVIPNRNEKDAIRNYLLQGDFDLSRQHFYEAPYYKTEADFSDMKLLSKAKAVNPDWIILCIGGGRQEKLGYFMRENFSQFNRVPVVLCTGGAISFLTGTQANIPTWADRMYLGWLFRIFYNPKMFGARYFDAAWRFPKLLWTSRRSLFADPSEIS